MDLRAGVGRPEYRTRPGILNVSDVRGGFISTL